MSVPRFAFQACFFGAPTSVPLNSFGLQRLGGLRHGQAKERALGTERNGSGDLCLPARGVVSRIPCASHLRGPLYENK